LIALQPDRHHEVSGDGWEIRVMKLSALAAGLAALFAAAPTLAQGPDLGRYDAARAPTVAEQLVICDLAEYLGSNPDLNATRIYVRRDDGFRFEPAIPPYVSRGGFWYDEDLERAYRRYRAAGVVTRDQIHQAQDVYSREMTDLFGRRHGGGLRLQRFLQAQSGFCDSLSKNAPAWR
jgi:hypothetical protein